MANSNQSPSLDQQRRRARAIIWSVVGVIVVINLLGVVWLILNPS